MPNVYRFAYLDRTREKPRTHEMRDGDATLELMDHLYQLGYSFQGPILSFPSSPVRVRSKLRQAAGAGSEKPLGPDDLLLLTTRPPMHDVGAETATKRSVAGENSLEKFIFRFFDSFFLRCTRTRIHLHKNLAGQLDSSYRNRASITFGLKQHANYTHWAHFERPWKKVPKNLNYTAAYVARTDALWPGGPALLAVFSVGAIETLAWCRLLRVRYPHLLDQKTFVFAEISMNPPIPHQPIDLSFADNWKVKTLLEL